MKEFQSIAPVNTVGQWVNAFNNNALAASDHTFYLGEILDRSVLYTGLETIGGKKISPLKNLDLQGIFPSDLIFDNWYIYFRVTNKIKLLTDQHLDLRQWADGNPHYLFLHADGAYRASYDPDALESEVRLCRFLIDPSQFFVQMFPTFPRFGSLLDNRLNPKLSGLVIYPIANGAIGMKDGSIDYSGINFSHHPMPDYYYFTSNDSPREFYYTTAQNVTDYSQSYTQIDASKYWNLETNWLTDVPKDKYTNIRVFYDFYMNKLVLQRGTKLYDSIQRAMDAIPAMDHPFPYESNMYPMLGVICIKQGYTNVTDPEQARFINFRTDTWEVTTSENFATDALARAQIANLFQEVGLLKDRVGTLEDQMKDLTGRFNNHLGDIEDPRNTKYQAGESAKNPHDITAKKIGLDSYLPYTPQTLPVSNPQKEYIAQVENGINNKISGLDNRFLRKDMNDITRYRITCGALDAKSRDSLASGTKGEIEGDMVRCSAQYMMINNTRWYVGTLPDNAVNGSYGVMA